MRRNPCVPGQRCAIAMGTALVFSLTPAIPALAGSLSVVSLSPARNSLSNPLTAPVSITFGQPINPATVNGNSFRVYGRWSGPLQGTFSFSNGNQTVTLNPGPGEKFAAGEQVFVHLSEAITGADSSPMQQGGFAWQFSVYTAPATLEFTEIATMSNRTSPGVSTRIYGAFASDLNNDSYLDLTTINEDSHDVRVFMNQANGTGQFDDFLTPTTPIGVEASPNEPGDFNNDGIVDGAIVASSTSNAWILLGNGDGSFAAPQSLSVGSGPHGIGVLDLDGDGDLDVVAASTTSNNLTMLINDGSGVFSNGGSFDSGSSGEWGMAAGDMDNDGITDLVVGTIFDDEVVVLRGNGDGTMTPITTVSAGGGPWQVALGDVNGDGNLDVATANSQSNSGSILLGDGMGGLGPATVVPTALHVVASDLGDLDGDGDLDWVLSHFGGGVWRMFTNDGAGNFTFHQEFDAPSNPSCAILFDFDNDLDLDVALTDEIADVVIFMSHQGVGGVPAVSAWGMTAMALTLLVAGSLVMRKRAIPCTA